MPLTKEQLLIPRYKVKDKYPGMELEPFYLGQIITLQWHREEDGEFSTEGFIHVPINHIPRSFMWQSFFELYKNIFEPLPWWSDRKPEDMPKYLKDQAGVYSKATWDVSMKLFTSDGELWHITENVMSFFEPATEEEYTAYINQKQ